MANKHLALVIDANVAQSAGEPKFEHGEAIYTKDQETASYCSELLDCVEKQQHKIAFCECLEEEWDKHKSSFSNQWLSIMTKRGRIVRNTLPDAVVRSCLEKINPALKQDTAAAESQKIAALEDVHLVGGALLADRFVISQDKKARKAFCAFSTDCQQLQQIVWINPALKNNFEFLNTHLESPENDVPKEHYLAWSN